MTNGIKPTKALMSNSWCAKRVGEENAGGHSTSFNPCYQWKVIKVEGGELEDRKGKMPKKKKTSFLERGLEAILGAFLAYLSGSATGVAQVLLLIAGVAVVLYAIFAD